MCDPAHPHTSRRRLDGPQRRPAGPARAGAARDYILHDAPARPLRRRSMNSAPGMAEQEGEAKVDAARQKTAQQLGPRRRGSPPRAAIFWARRSMCWAIIAAAGEEDALSLRYQAMRTAWENRVRGVAAAGAGAPLRTRRRASGRSDPGHRAVVVVLRGQKLRRGSARFLMPTAAAVLGPARGGIGFPAPLRLGRVVTVAVGGRRRAASVAAWRWPPRREESEQGKGRPDQDRHRLGSFLPRSHIPDPDEGLGSTAWRCFGPSIPLSISSW